ncbi:hypothetical protein ACRQG2_00730, partial [Actinotignum sp. GS-2025c]|uniref:hypothetical protein n=1 Tax=Actinotignum sp. GS-2025c TaxID=3427276 RepID=UPI003F471A58
EAWPPTPHAYARSAAAPSSYHRGAHGAPHRRTVPLRHPSVAPSHRRAHRRRVRTVGTTAM